MIAPRVELRLGRTGKWRYVVIGRNGEVLCTSQHYTSKRRAVTGSQALLATVREGDVFMPVIDMTKRRSR